MSASATSLVQFVEDLRATVPDDIHPLAQRRIHQWFGEIREAYNAGDLAEVALLLRLIKAKVDSEVAWERHKEGGPLPFDMDEAVT